MRSLLPAAVEREDAYDPREDFARDRILGGDRDLPRLRPCMRPTPDLAANREVGLVVVDADALLGWSVQEVVDALWSSAGAVPPCRPSAARCTNVPRLLAALDQGSAPQTAGWLDILLRFPIDPRMCAPAIDMSIKFVSSTAGPTRTRAFKLAELVADGRCSEAPLEPLLGEAEPIRRVLSGSSAERFDSLRGVHDSCRAPIGSGEFPRCRKPAECAHCGLETLGGHVILGGFEIGPIVEGRVTMQP